ncbi:MAG: hypothetical protein ACRCTD_09200 [Beijerinckiaceae bacterium]
MQLGALIRRLEDDNDAAHAMEALGNVILMFRVQQMGLQHDETPGAYLAGAARRFANQGSDEDWLALMTAIEKTDDPARVVISKILHWALDKDNTAHSADACGCGSGTGACNDHT